MSRALALHSADVVVALHLCGATGTLTQIAESLGLVPSQVHAALARLDSSGLLRSGKRVTNPRALAEFLAYGVRYAFPVHRERLTSGVPTAYSAPPLSSDVDATDVLVWSAPEHPGAVQGFAIRPLYRAAPRLLDRAPNTYRLLAIVDALRLGDPRIRLPARQRLDAALGLG